MRLFSLMLCCLFLGLLGRGEDVQAQKVLTPRRPIPALVKAQTVLVRVVVNDQFTNPKPLLEIITNRFHELHFKVVTDPTQPHDVGVVFSCQEASGSFLNSSLLHPPSEPPCFFHYIYHGTPIEWQRIDTIVFNEGILAIKRVSFFPPTREPFPQSVRYLQVFDFPLLLAAEWGQVHRLLRALDHTETPLRQKRKILNLLGVIQAESAIPRLLQALHEPELIVPALHALGHFGARVRPALVQTLQTSTDPTVQAAAVKSLGQIGARTGDTSVTPLLLTFLTDPTTPIHVKIEIVWALGKAPDFRAFPALKRLEEEIWLKHSQDPALQQLRKAVDWSIREVRQGGHTDDY
ncbi:MAG: HEAT repeat domain-containing protein [Nitrospirae bacterium]|nr:MAG: HEAT repeat domain-containing protein [Nitrospirota bacterium]